MKEKNSEDTVSLEKQLLEKIGVYKDFRNSESNELYFNNLYHKTMSRVDTKNGKRSFSLNPAFGFIVIFIISFVVSFQFINFNSEISLSDEEFLFSDTSLLMEDEEFLSSLLDEEINLDYVAFFMDENNFANSSYLNDEIIQLSEPEFENFYNNLKYKKIL